MNDIELDPIIISIVGVKNTSDCWLNLNNGESLRCSIDLVAKYYLKKGMSLEPELLNSINTDQRIINIKKSAYKYATYKPRTVFQVRDKLKQLGYDLSEIDAGIEFLKQFNLLDDETYAANYIKMRAKSKKFGKSRIIVELKKLGVNEHIIESALYHEYDEEDAYSTAVEAFNKKIRMLQNKPIDKQKRSMIDYLIRRGFNWQLINRIIEEKMNEDIF